MNGDDLLKEFERRIMKEKGTKSVTTSVLAKTIGVTPPQLANYRGKELTPRQVVNLIEKYSKAIERQLVENTVVPIVEFLHIDLTESRRGARWEIFRSKDDQGVEHPYFSGLRRSLESKHGIYIFHDSRGRAIYAGKAQRLSLWKEMNNAFNRDRGEVQNIKRVAHPFNRVEYRAPQEQHRQIMKQAVPLHDVASYCSAYEVPDQLIGKFEALIVRAFANDLLNVRMENF
jgi:hypothetical protein